MAIIIENPGLLTSVQDAGRFGMQRYGMSPAGAMDLDSMKLANILAGNDPNTGTLECTYMGPAIRFEEDEVIAIAGRPDPTERSTKLRIPCRNVRL